MRRLANAVTNHPLRVLIAWVIALAVITVLTRPGGPADPADAMKADQTNFLPTHYESVRAARLLSKGFPPPDGAKATIVIRRTDAKPLTAVDASRAERLAEKVGAVDGARLAKADRNGMSPNHKVLLGSVVFDRTQFDRLLVNDVDRLRDRSKAIFAGSGLSAGYAGEAATQVDASKREGLTSMLTMLVILVLLIVLFRSLVVGFFDVLLVALVGAVATGLIAIAAAVLGFSLTTDATGLLPIVVLGVGTDYVVFLLHRYREHLREGDEPRVAMRRAMRRIGPAIGFSALTVVVSLSALLLSSLKSMQVLGPALGFGVLMTLIAALTLVPAVAVMFGRRLFWPGHTLTSYGTARASRTARFVVGKPVGAVVASLAVLAAIAIPALGFKPDYNVESQVPGSPSAKAFDQLRKGFPEGALDPTQVMIVKDGAGRLTAKQVAPVVRALRHADGVGDVQEPVLSRDGRIAQVGALLDSSPFSKAALDTIDNDIRPAMAKATPSGATVEVGGNTSAYADVRDAINKDMKVIFPVAALLVGLILVILLRSLAVPLFVMGGVVAGFL